MLLTLSFAAALLGRTQPAFNYQGTQHSSLYERIITSPDPEQKNGYEDYVRAADIVNDGAAGLYMNWTADQYKNLLSDFQDAPISEKASFEAILPEAKRLNEVGYLGVQREFFQRYGSAIDLILKGNEKQVWEPRKSLSTETLLPEYYYFKVLARLIVAAAYVEFAEGSPNVGSKYLLEGLKFSKKMATSFMVGELVGIASNGIILRGFQDHLDQIPLNSWKGVRDFCDDDLSKSDSIVSAFRLEKHMSERLLSPEESQTFIKETAHELNQGGFPEAAKAIDAMSPADMQRTMSDVRVNMEQRFDSAITRFSSPENTWFERSDGLAPGSTADGTVDGSDYLTVLEKLVSATSVNTDQILVAVARERAQLRILRLHALIQSYRWLNGHLPNKLADAASPDDVVDPFSGKTFRYQPIVMDRYKLYSEGRGDYKELGLVVHHTLGQAPQGTPPPSTQQPR